MRLVKPDKIGVGPKLKFVDYMIGGFVLFYCPTQSTITFFMKRDELCFLDHVTIL